MNAVRRPGMRGFVVVLLAATAGCSSGGPVSTTPGSGPTGTSAATPSASPSTSAAPRAVDASVVVRVDDGAGTRSEVTLTCTAAGEAGGTHPDPGAACAALAVLPPPTPGDVACTQQYGGPQTAVVEGTLDGRPVRAEFDRQDGCGIARWDQAVALLGPAG